MLSTLLALPMPRSLPYLDDGQPLPGVGAGVELIGLVRAAVAPGLLTELT